MINQDISQIPRFIKDRIETTYRMQKHVGLGLRNRYRVDVFQGKNLAKKNRTNSYQEKYDKEIFELYKSYESGGGKETVTDSRQSIFSSFWVKLWIVFLPVAVFYCGYNLYIFLNGSESEVSNNTEEAKFTPDKNHNDMVVNLSPAVEKPLSTKWRITGELKKDNKSFVILADNENRLRLEPSSQFSFSGRMLQGEIDGEIVSYFSGESK